MISAIKILNDIEYDEGKAMGFPQVKREVAIKAMQEYTNKTLKKLKREVEEKEKELDEKVSRLQLSSNPDDWILSNGVQQVKIGVHSAIQIINEEINE